MKIKQIKKITGKIKVLTGLHIGSGDATMEISGMDNPIIRNPVNNEPYIPGSSIKGKIRSLMEWETGNLNVSEKNGAVHTCKDNESAMSCPICRVFGISASNDIQVGPTRLIVRDCMMTEQYSKAMKEGKPIIEEKHENSINRITAGAMPRPIERVAEGVEFDFDISYKIIDMDDDGKTDEDFFDEVVLKGMSLLQQDYIGGGGSRGNGRIKFIELKDEDGNDIKLPEIN